MGREETLASFRSVSQWFLERWREWGIGKAHQSLSWHPLSQLASAGLLSSLGLLSPQTPLSLASTDGLVKRLEELERTAELYKGR